MPFKEPDPTDPNMLVGVLLPADAEATRDMAYMFAEEFARMGYTREQLLGIFKTPYYGGAHGAYLELGEKAIRDIIDECLNAWGRAKVTVQEVQNDANAASHRRASGQVFLPRDAGDDLGDGWNDLNATKKERDDE